MSPHKPTRDDATSAADPRQLHDDARPEPIGGGTADPKLASGRREVGSAAENAADPPHVTVNDRDAPLQQKEGRPGDIAALPANASGAEEKPAATGGIHPESAYEGRSEEDKEQPPSERAR